MNLRHQVNQSSEIVFDYLTDMTKFVSIHPVIEKLERVGGNDYLVFETLKFGFIPFSFTYPATVCGDQASKSVVMNARVMKVATIEFRFQISEGDGVSIIDEWILVNSVLPLKSLIQQVIKKQHLQFFENLQSVV
jgi:carbon monoxide dehydrogenase subunit G